MIGPYGRRYPWLYWIAIAAALALLIVHFIDGAEWTTVAAFVLIAVAVVVRPGGIRGPRRR